MWTYVVSFLVVNKYGLIYLSYCVSLLITFVAGFLSVSWFFGTEVKRKVLYRFNSLSLRPPSTGLTAVLERITKERLTWRIDKRLSGASIIDEPFNEVLDLFMQDFVDPWYHNISKDEEFKYEVRKTIQAVVVNLSAKLRDVDFINLFTGPLLRDMTNHLRIYKRTKDRLRVYSNYTPQEEVKVFFDYEAEFGVICTDKEAELSYVRHLSDLLLYLLLPETSFQCYPMRTLLRELIATCGAIPSMDSVVEPDYVNQCFMAWLKDDCLTAESFLGSIRCCESLAELEHMEDRLQKDIQRLRAMDSGNISSWKQQLDSLMYALRFCTIRYQNILEPGTELESDALYNVSTEATTAFPPDKPCPCIPLKLILENSIALKYFIDFMNHIKSEKFLHVWLAIDSFRVALQERLAQAQLEARTLSEAEENMFRKEAHRIFQEVLGDENRLPLDPKLVVRLETGIKSLPISLTLFDELKECIFRELNSNRKYYTSFRKSLLYYRCLTELDLSHTDAVPDSPKTVSPTISPTGRLTADIPHVSSVAGGSRQDALYGVVMNYRSEDGTETQWVVPRSFEDFKKLQTKLADQIPQVNLPKSSFLSGFDKDYISNRKDALNGYLKGVFDEGVIQSPEVMESVMDFISTDSPFSDQDTEFVASPEASSVDDEENIPLKVLILLTDEVFDMKNRNQWFRARMVTFLRGIVRATFGGKINNKIQEYVEWLTSPEYISDMLILFRDTFWPNGVWAEASPARSSGDECLTKFMAHTKLQGMVSDEMRKIIGNDTVREGISIVFSMFQQPEFNRLLFYQMLESTLDTIFPDNKVKHTLSLLRTKINNKANTEQRVK